MQFRVYLMVTIFYDFNAFDQVLWTAVATEHCYHCIECNLGLAQIRRRAFDEHVFGLQCYLAVVSCSHKQRR